MADRNCSSPSSPAPVIITSTSEQIQSDADDSNSLSNTRDFKNSADDSLSCNDNASCKHQTPDSNSKLLFSDPTISSSSGSRNGVSDLKEKDNIGKTASFLRPSILSSGSSFVTTKNVETSKSDTSFSLNCPKLNINPSKFGDASFTSTPKNFFLNSLNFGQEKNETTLDSSLKESNKGAISESKSCNPTLGIFSSSLNPNSDPSVSTIPKTSIVTVPNFVFGENLHERVTDSVKTTNVKDESSSEIKSNGTSDMLFTSVISSKEIKENFSNNIFSNSAKEASSLIENAAKCQEARATKRKYEEVLVTTGEEDEENILQVNVKLFAFDNGTWVERGRGILRLNDKVSEKTTSSRIVIRTVGSLRVVLNTKIWSEMSLNRASERSARLTAMDPNGQVKIFLIQANLKDMATLYPLLENRIKLCKEQESENEESPQKKIALEKDKM